MLSVYTIEQASEWDAIVRSFSNYDTYWLGGYVKAFELHGEGEPLLFFYQSENTRAINVVMKRDISKCEYFEGKIAKGEWFDFSTPYGYGGWIIEGDDSASVFNDYEKWCVENNVICEFVRFHPVVKNHACCDNFYTVIPLGETITMDLSSPEVIWENITSKNRNMIRKAQKNGVRIYHGRYPEIFKIFKEIYNETMDKDNAAEYYYFADDFYESILNDLSQNAQVFYAVYEEKIIAASIMLSANGKMNYHLSGSRREFSSLAPTNLLLYEAALWGSENGCKTLYLGGGVGSAEDGLFKFKRSFYRKDDLNRFHIGKRIFNTDKYNELVNMRNDAVNSSFFPAYRSTID